MRKQDVIDEFVTMKALAGAIGISARSVALWPDEIPPHRAAQIREAINAKIVRLQEMVK